jgi:hypothetical protein
VASPFPVIGIVSDRVNELDRYIKGWDYFPPKDALGLFRIYRQLHIQTKVKIVSSKDQWVVEVDIFPSGNMLVIGTLDSSCLPQAKAPGVAQVTAGQAVNDWNSTISSAFFQFHAVLQKSRALSVTVRPAKHRIESFLVKPLSYGIAQYPLDSSSLQAPDEYFAHVAPGELLWVVKGVDDHDVGITQLGPCAVCNSVPKPVRLATRS